MRVPGPLGTSSAALKALRGLRNGSYLHPLTRSRRECVLLTLHTILEMRFLREALGISVNRGSLPL